MNSDKMNAALEWWRNVDVYAMLKKYGYQDEKKPWKYRPLSNKGILLMYLQEHKIIE